MRFLSSVLPALAFFLHSTNTHTALMQQEFSKEEKATIDDMNKHLYSNNW